jgi:hypothetical protein
MDAFGDCDLALEIQDGAEAAELRSKALEVHRSVNGVKMSIKQVKSSQVSEVHTVASTPLFQAEPVETDAEFKAAVTTGGDEFDSDNLLREYQQLGSDDNEEIEIVDADYDSDEEHDDTCHHPGQELHGRGQARITEINDEFDSDGEMVVNGEHELPSDDECGEKIRVLKKEFDSDDD